MFSFIPYAAELNLRSEAFDISSCLFCNVVSTYYNNV